MDERHELADLLAAIGIKIDSIQYMMIRIFATIAAVALCLSAQAAIVSSNLLTFTSINFATNTGSAVGLGTVIIPQTTFSIQSVGTSTNTGLGGTIYVGLSTNFANMTAVGSYSATNDTIASVTLTNSTIPIYCVFQARNTTTNAASIGAQTIQNR